MRQGSVTHRSRGLPAAIPLAGHAGTALQAVPIVALKCHRLPGCREESVTINLPSVGYDWVDADSPWKLGCAGRVGAKGNTINIAVNIATTKSAWCPHKHPHP